MEITITIKIDEDELKNVEIENTNEEEISKTTSDYARWFCDDCIGWSKDAESNLIFLQYQQSYANEKLRAQRYLFLNDVYGMLGIPKSKTGQMVGWIYDEENPVGDNYVDFGIFEERNKDFVNGLNPTILLDFNVDGSILDHIGFFNPF